MRAYLAGPVSLAILASCGGTDPEPGNEAGISAASTESLQGHASVEAKTKVQAAATGALSVGDLPLRKGVYARTGEVQGETPICPPALALLATFDGEGFGGRNSIGCRFDATQKNGPTWSGTQTCTDTYTSEKTTEDWAVTVDSPTRYTQENRYGTSTFELCPDEKLSNWNV